MMDGPDFCEAQFAAKLVATTVSSPTGAMCASSKWPAFVVPSAEPTTMWTCTYGVPFRVEISPISETIYVLSLISIRLNAPTSGSPQPSSAPGASPPMPVMWPDVILFFATKS